jgi:hypothetical protein
VTTPVGGYLDHPHHRGAGVTSAVSCVSSQIRKVSTAMPKIASLLAAAALATALYTGTALYAGTVPLTHAAASTPTASAPVPPMGIGWD